MIDAQSASAKAKALPMHAGGSSFANMFQCSNVGAKIQTDPRTRGFLMQLDFVRILQDAKRNPININRYINDPRMQVMRVLLGVNVQIPSQEDMDNEKWDKDKAYDSPLFIDRSAPSKRETSNSTQSKPTPPVQEPEPMEISTEEKEKKERKAEAFKEKELGNQTYKKKQFEEAIAHYTKAIELDDDDMSFLTNRAVVYFKMAQYKEAIKDCDKAVERGREVRANYKIIAQALTRKGNAFVKMAKTSKDNDPAIESFHKALTEH